MAPPSAIEIEGVTDTEAIALPDPLTINGIASRRLKAGRLVAGTAAGTSSDLFKTPVSMIYLSGISSLTLKKDHWKTKSQTMGPYVTPSPLLFTR